MNISRISFAATLCGLVLIGASCGSSPDGGVFVTEDISGEWQQKVFVGQDGRKEVTIAGVNVEKIEVDPSNADTYYLATREDGIWKTTSKGDQWNQLPVAPDRIRDIEVHPQNPDIVYSIKNANIIKSTDGGNEMWEVVYTDAQNAIITRIEIDWFTPSRIFAVTSIGTVLLSEDDGVTWERIYEVDEPLIGIYMSQQDSRVIYIHELDRGVHKTIDGGKNWTDLYSEDFLKQYRKAEQVKHVALSPNNDNVLYTVSKEGILYTTDGGVTWQFMKTLIEQGVDQNTGIANITVKPGEPSTILFTVGRLIHKTTDGGASWNSIESFPSSRNISYLTLHPNNPDLILAGVQEVEEKRGGLLTPPSR